MSASSEIEVESARASGREHADNRLCRGTNDQKAKERQSSRELILKADQSLKKKVEENCGCKYKKD